MPTQLQQMRNDSLVSTILIGDKAYWVKDNTMYECEIRGGRVDISHAQPIDAMAMTDEQVAYLMDFLDKTK